VVGIQPLLNHACCEAQSLVAHGRFHRLEVQSRRRFPTHQSRNLNGEVVCQSFAECGFF
jgi:hypothetical protein